MPNERLHISTVALVHRPAPARADPCCGRRGRGAISRDRTHGCAGQPLIFFVAKGPANACGPGCSEWIAAEGRFNSDAPQRLRDFLATLSRRDLPLFFNSAGGAAQSGNGGGLAVARAPHDRRRRPHRAGWMPSYRSDRRCLRSHVMQSKAEHRARLITAGARYSCRLRRRLCGRFRPPGRSRCPARYSLGPSPEKRARRQRRRGPPVLEALSCGVWSRCRPHRCRDQDQRR